ncbi:MAG: type II toxin-antitoxin system Phd/YefM family antitoxin [Alphaproteobacteria bacterium]
MKRTTGRIGAGEFKARCLKLIDEVSRGRTPLVITKRGKPVAKLVPMEDTPRNLFGRLAGTVTVKGDIIESNDVTWDANA